MHLTTPATRRSPLTPDRFLYFMLMVLLLASACTRREAFPEESESDPDETPAERYDGKLLAQVILDSVNYIVPKQELYQPFIREFGDGTVVDKVMIRKVQETKEDSAVYYLVGLGIRSGAFKSMALELDMTSDNSLYLSSKGGKHTCQAAPGCEFCYFTYSGNKITGCECSSRAPGNNCVHKFSQQNSLLKDVQLSNSKQGKR
ncbi:hypothetical protein [Pontibacter liquoris]|uniref:hypothetical protein n=1 Tax=Pontibacter liquoris TaxID=2905677 RepID=UPI001FA72033|nr:hypothetical protein [Pontibacter liquoris]